MTEARYNSDSPNHDRMMAWSRLQRQEDIWQSLPVRTWLFAVCMMVCINEKMAPFLSFVKLCLYTLERGR